MPSAWSLTRVERVFPKASRPGRFRMADLLDEAVKQGTAEERERWLSAIDPEVSTIQERIKERLEAKLS